MLLSKVNTSEVISDNIPIPCTLKALKSVSDDILESIPLI